MYHPHIYNRSSFPILLLYMNYQVFSKKLLLYAWYKPKGGGNKTKVVETGITAAFPQNVFFTL